MQQALLIAAAAVLAVAALGAVIRRWVPQVAWVGVGVGVAISVRVLLTASMAWVAFRLLRERFDAARLAVATVVSLFGLWSAITAAAMLYVVLFKRHTIADE